MQINKVGQLFPKNTKNKKILLIVAHPDDEIIAAGGTLIRAEQENIDTYVCCLSKGELGIFSRNYQENIVEVRENEYEEAMKYVGVSKYYHFNIPDTRFVNNKKRVEKIVSKLIEDINPQCIITHDPSGISNHPDHILTSRVVYEIVKGRFSNSINLYYSSISEDEQELRKATSNSINFDNLQKATHIIDIENFIEQKGHLYRVYESQNISKKFSIPIERWFAFHHFEHFHKVDFRKSYRFDFYPFSTVGVSFNPD